MVLRSFLGYLVRFSLLLVHILLTKDIFLIITEENLQKTNAKKIYIKKQPSVPAKDYGCFLFYICISLILKNIPFFSISSSYVPNSATPPFSITALLSASRIVDSLCATIKVVLSMNHYFLQTFYNFK